ncbi:MAG TPA: ABC transporter substrate-binding protein [Desulfobacteraceae bacterium]|nr:ABC transporter substrate-binding protein [Desulfobacteraceae bacterium]
MNMKADFYRLIVLAVFLTYGLCPAMAEESKKFKVLVVMSYEEDFLWCKEIKQGIDNVLGKTCEIRYTYLNTRHSLEATAKVQEVYKLYQEFQPHGVIAADDNAQTMFIIPYLKDKVKIPVMFCGVNEEAEKYGFPASNVSGVLERPHFAESIAFVQQMVPTVKTVGYIWGNHATAKGFHQQVQKEKDDYSAKSVDFKFVNTMDEAIESVKDLKTKCDAIFVDILRGIKDKDGKPLDEDYIVPILAKTFGKPVLTANAYMMRFGALCAVVKTGNEQGETSANMLLKAMNGTPVSQIPITKNYQGKRMINVTALKALGITPKPAALKGAELVKTEE